MRKKWNKESEVGKGRIKVVRGIGGKIEKIDSGIGKKKGKSEIGIEKGRKLKKKIEESVKEIEIGIDIILSERRRKEGKIEEKERKRNIDEDILKC